MDHLLIDLGILVNLLDSERFQYFVIFLFFFFFGYVFTLLLKMKIKGKIKNC